MKKSYEMNMTEGPLLGKIILFTIPVMLSGLLQLLFNAVDVIVVGNYVGDEALAAVGSTGALINLFIGLFMGLSVGTNVMVARYYGAKRFDEMQQTLHTAVASSVFLGAFVAVMAQILAYPILRLMGTPEDVIDQSALYFRIYLAGSPVNLLYNFSAAALRAVGDTRRPLIYLTIGGVANVFLNLFFVIVVGIGVAGVAIGTLASQTVSAVLVVRCLLKSSGSLRLVPSELRIRKDKFLGMMAIGLPSGVQGMIFSLSNIVIQSSINSFGKIAMAGNTAAANIEGFVYIAMNSMHQSCISFTSQNLGAKKPDRVLKTLGLCLAIVLVLGLAMGNIVYAFAPRLLRIYTDTDEAVGYGLTRMGLVCMPYFLCGLMDVAVGALRGIGASLIPMLTSVFGC
ncbi:MAG: MATE family efflux transporter, partial [Lachnospiraceae bacterium]|nr:MATE family efflux transporter [Lachnospiraceae bacterium]